MKRQHDRRYGDSTPAGALTMGHESNYTVARHHDGSFQIERTTEPFHGSVAYVTPAFARTGQQAGWRLKPLVAIQGAKSKIWPTTAEAITATKLMTPAAVKYAVEEATHPSSSQNADGEP
jgi:hypothetical protein